MNTSFSFVSRFTFASLLLSAGLLAACGPVVVDGGDSGETDDSLQGAGQSSNGNGNGPKPDESEAIAIRYADLPDVDTGSGSSSGSGGGTEPHPDTLFIKISDQTIACQDPHAALGCGSHWEVSIGIPPALQVPGVISLSSPDVIAYATATGPGGGDDCWWGGGSFMDGTVEILSIDSEKVEVRLENTWAYDFDANGEYTALRCF